MNRRALLQLGGVTGISSLAGCVGLFETQPIGEPPLVENRPDRVYQPTHVEGMEMIGMVPAEDRMIGLMFSYPHRFWTTTGTRTEQVNIQRGDSVHLMASVWDMATKTVLPVEAGLQFEITQNNELITDRAPWPMLSQPMGFHFGDNISLPGNGTYTVRVSVGPVTLNRLGTFTGKFGTAGTVEFEFEYQQSVRDDIMYRELPDVRGQPGAVSPMEMAMMPLSRAPSRNDLPGRILGETRTGDAVFVVTGTDIDDGMYLAICPRTPYNQYVLPMMAVSVTLTRNGRTVVTQQLDKAIDPERNYHYGTTVDQIAPGDELTISVETPPQVSRHEGYETAFITMPDTTITIP